MSESEHKQVGLTIESERNINSQTENDNDIGKLIWLIPLYTFFYSILAIWLLIDGWLTGFSSVLNLWHLDVGNKVPTQVPFLFFTIVGSLLGSAVLSITSFHRHYAIYQSFNSKHSWGFFLTPLLATLVGCLVFAVIQSGLLVLTGDIANESDPTRATLGYVAIGGVAGYNWDIFVKKLENLSQELLKPSSAKN